MGIMEKIIMLLVSIVVIIFAIFDAIGIFILILICLQGCSTSTKVVKVPILARTPKIEITKKPWLPIADLKKNSSPDDVMKSYVASIQILQGDDSGLRKIIDGYNN